MSGLSDYLENKVLDYVLKQTSFSTTNVYVALHDGAPGDTGANEISGGSYARQQVAAAGWNAASGGATDNVNAITFTSLPAKTLVAVSIWDALTTGNNLFNAWLSTVRKNFVCSDTAGDLIRTPAHGLVADDRVAFKAGDSGTVPTGLDETTLYFVLASGLTTDDFKVSTSSGGSAVNITAVGYGKWWKVVPQVINAGGTFQINAGNLDLALF